MSKVTQNFILEHYPKTNMEAKITSLKRKSSVIRFAIKEENLGCEDPSENEHI